MPLQSRVAGRMEAEGRKPSGRPSQSQTILLASTKWSTIRPESLAPAEDVKKVERRLTSDEKKALEKPDTLEDA